MYVAVPQIGWWQASSNLYQHWGSTGVKFLHLSFTPTVRFLYLAHF